MKHSNVFSVCNQKGGVGKTTTAINLSSGLAKHGYKVLLIDIDPQANATSGVGHEKEGDFPSTYEVIIGSTLLKDAVRPTGIPNLSIVPSNSELGGAEIELIQVHEREFLLRKCLEELDERFDYVLIDCPPSLGLLTINALTASRYILIPLQCEYYALEGLGQLIQTYTLVNQKLNEELEIGAILLTMADFRTNLTDQVIRDVRNHFNDMVLDSVIPRSVSLGEAPSFGKPGILYDSTSRGAKAYLSAVKEFIRRFPVIEEPKADTDTVRQEESQ